jgi:hypothetical protein
MIAAQGFKTTHRVWTAARKLSPALAVLLLAAVVSGCVQPRKVPTGATESPAAEAVTPPAATQETALPKAPEIDDDPAQLLEMSRDDLNGLLGQPSLVRRESPAEIWQYRGKDCILDVFLYADGDSKDGPYKVVYSEARDRNAGTTDQRACLNKLLQAQLNS